MADPRCSHFEGRIGCASYRVFSTCTCAMVVRESNPPERLHLESTPSYAVRSGDECVTGDFSKHWGMAAGGMALPPALLKLRRSSERGRNKYDAIGSMDGE